MKIHQQNTRGGFSLFEIITGIAVIGILTASALGSFRDMAESMREAEAQKQARQFSIATDVYVAFGGEIPEGATPEEVLAKLKTTADADSAEQVAGLTGSFIDGRMGIGGSSESESDSQ
jgi:prepilin-type N-terminal cleavage/methylation domain-containing protein